MIILFHAKLCGFLTDSGTYSSEWRNAQTFTLASALALCRKSLEEDTFIFIPIHREDLEVAALAKGAH